MRPEPGAPEGLGRAAPSDVRIRVTWLETTVAPEAPPRAVRRVVIAPAEAAGPGWAPYLLAALAGVLLLLATVAWPLWQPVGIWLEERLTQAGPRP